MEGNRGWNYFQRSWDSELGLPGLFHSISGRVCTSIKQKRKQHFLKMTKKADRVIKASDSTIG